MPNRADPQRIIALAEECLDVPFVHQGRSMRGMDCAGVLQHILHGMGLPYLDNKGYPGRPFDGQLEKILLAEPSLVPIKKHELSAGDVIVARIKRAPQHLLICTGSTVIHSYKDTGRVVQQRLIRWQSNITHVFRIISNEGQP